MSVQEWIAQIQAHKLLVIGSGVFVIAVLIFVIRSWRKNPLRAGLAFLAGALLLSGFVTLQSFVELSNLVRAAHSWPTAPGVILISKTESFYVNVKDPQTNRVSKTKSGQTTITYRYTIPASATYTSSTVHLSNRPNSSRYLNEYPVGKNVTVHYNQNNPSQAFLELESTASLLGLFVGMILLAMGLGIIYAMTRIKSLNEIGMWRGRPEGPDSASSNYDQP